MYNQWPTGAPPTSSYGNYEYDTRYTLQSSYSSYPSRTSPTIPDPSSDSRRLAPLQTQAGPYSTVNSNAHIRSPTASYPHTYYSQEQGNSYPYTNVPTNHSHHVTPHSVSQPRMEPRATSPFNRGAHPDSSQQAYSAPPVSPTTDEPMIKKKRKRADAAQLKVLNDVYSRTAFPSTEERLSLAKQLDMSPRSVQIWFQNKRQSMRQTNRQSSTLHQSFSIAPGQDAVDEVPYGSSIGYGSSNMSVVAGSSYGMPRSSPDSNRATMNSTSPSIPPRRPGSSAGAVDSRKWGSYQ
ncbi:hypothetical protein ONZ45_g8730 [Pleurotus djamor]|nr:hypothetical protein ONZ45_g8730 [Pleurotus djamor]